MKRKIMLAIALCSLTLGLARKAIHAYEAEATRTEERERLCPQGFQEWKTWREIVVTGARVLGYTGRLTEIHNKFEICKQSFEDLGVKKACFHNLHKFTSHEYLGHTQNHSMGFAQNDQAYLKSLHANSLASLPEELLTPEFLSLMEKGDHKSLNEAISYVKALWGDKVIAFPYVSRHLPSVDDAATYGRFLVYLVGETRDIATQFAIRTEASQATAQSISVISIAKKGKTQVYFNDLIREKVAGKVQARDRLQINGRMENCYTCHKSPLIPIVPEPSQFNFELFGEQLTDVNSLFSKYAGAEYVGADSANYGPAMGLEKELTPEEFQLCTDGKELTIDRKTISELGRCQDCHNGRTRGVLNYPSGLNSQLPGGKSLSAAFIKNYGLMPPTHEDLGADTLEALEACLHRDYYGDIKNIRAGRLNRWLLQEDCQ